jgi:outer membrane protein OmpA-like peptidoglycan-associated protein
VARALVPSDEPASKARIYRASTPGERWWFALLLVPVLLTAALVATRGDDIEAQLADETTAALREAGLAKTRVEVSGRSATLLVPTGESLEQAARTARSVEGIGDITVEHVARNKAEALACAGLQPKIDAALPARGISFAGRTPDLTSSGAASLRAVARLLVRCPSAMVVAEGHADSTIVKGADLSQRRAEAVRARLAAAGVDKTRVDVRGYGDAIPVADNDTAAGRAKNNRVTIRVEG